MKPDKVVLIEHERTYPGRFTELLTQRLRDPVRGELPKHIQLGQAIAELIRDGALSPGDQILPEQQLVTVAGMSLGTVQKALNRLAIDGWVIRKHGHGTFVANPERPVTEVWHDQFLDHFRFRDPDANRFLPVHTELIERKMIPAPAPCQPFLGDDPAGFVTLIRRIQVGGKFSCLSRIYLRASRFSSLLKLPDHSFENVNLKEIFAQQFNAPTTGLAQSVNVEVLPPAICAFLSIRSKPFGLVLRIEASTLKGVPLSYQEIFVPPTIYPLDVSLVDRADTPAAGGIASSRSVDGNSGPWNFPQRIARTRALPA
jgi:GntR family transcriptional regulator